MEREDLVDSPEHDLRDTDRRQDATMRKNLTFDKAYTSTVYHPGIRWGERVTPHSLGTPDGNDSGSTSICSLHKDIQAAYQSDPLFSRQKYTQRLKSQEGLWYACDKIVMPSSPLLKRRILELCHDNQLSDHVGITKTHDLVARTFLWSGLRADVEDYVSCEMLGMDKRMSSAFHPQTEDRRGCLELT
jgi:hypothetical protein